jgi:DHA3 family macrolide efflux protein-like MFS transporter
VQGAPLTAVWQERTPPERQGAILGAKKLLGQGLYPPAVLLGGALTAACIRSARRPRSASWSSRAGSARRSWASRCCVHAGSAPCSPGRPATGPSADQSSDSTGSGSSSSVTPESTSSGRNG